MCHIKPLNRPRPTSVLQVVIIIVVRMFSGLKWIPFCLLLFTSLCVGDILVQEGYKSFQGPSTPTEVTLIFSVSEILDVDDKGNQICLEGDLSMSWVEPRLTLNQSEEHQSYDEYVLLPFELQKALWIPDLWIESLRDFRLHQSLDQHLSMRFYPQNNTILYWQSVSITVSCPMNFAFYPFDIQSCPLRFSSNANTLAKLHYNGWINYATYVIYSQGALQYTRYEITMDEEISFHSRFTNQIWPQIKATFSFQRRKLDHVLQTYQTTACLVCLSWISFLIPPYIVPGRMVLLVTLLLVLFSTYQNEHKISPRSSDPKAQDVWFVGCMLFVLSAVCEYAILLFIKRLIIKKKRQEIEETSRWTDGDSSSSSTTPVTPKSPKFAEDDDSLEFHPKSRNQPKYLVKFDTSSIRLPKSAMIPRYKSANRVKHIQIQSSKSEMKENPLKVMDTGSEYGDINETDMEGEERLEKMDEWALKIFPLCFLIFNITFWCLYLLKEQTYPREERGRKG